MIRCAIMMLAQPAVPARPPQRCRPKTSRPPPASIRLIGQYRPSLATGSTRENRRQHAAAIQGADAVQQMNHAVPKPARLATTLAGRRASVSLNQYLATQRFALLNSSVARLSFWLNQTRYRSPRNNAVPAPRRMMPIVSKDAPRKCRITHPTIPAKEWTSPRKSSLSRATRHTPGIKREVAHCAQPLVTSSLFVVWI